MLLGKGKRATLVAVFFICCASSPGQPGKSYKYQLNSNSQGLEVTNGNQSLILHYSISELNIENIDNENGTFYRISVPGHIPTVVPGNPELPVLSRLIALPGASEFKIRISEVKSERISPRTKKIHGILYPVQESESKDQDRKKTSFQIDRTIYAHRGLISSDTVRIEPLGKLRNNELADIYISPVRYDPHSNILEIITSMKIEITFSGKGSHSSKSLNSESVLFNEILNKGTIDYNPGEVIPGFSDKPVQMVIITDTAFKKQLEPFFKWKTQKGFKLKVLYKGAGLAGNTYTQLKDTLTKIYRASANTGAPPEYLLIIGDVNRVPYYGATGGTANITDMYYGEFDGNGDYIPDMFIGRLPVADSNELKTVVKKIIQYEKFEFADSNKFYSRALITAGNDATYANHMNGQVKYATTNYLNNSNGINCFNFSYPQSTANSAIDSIRKLINEGVSFLNYTGHGSSDGWLYTAAGSTFYLNSSDINNLVNKNMYPFVFSNACRTSQFNLASAFGNRMVLAGDKGAIGFIGCSNDSYWDEDIYWSLGVCTPGANPTYQTSGPGAYDRLFHTHGEPASEWYITMGQVNYSGNLSVSASNSYRKKYYWETYNLVGDPSIIPIIGKPAPFKTSLPDTLPNKIKTFTIDADPFSYVAVSHSDTLWDASYVGPSGSVSLDMPGLSNDSCLVVMTGQNKIPLIKKVYISDIKNEYINLTSHSVNDSPGNNNGIADYGESFYLKLTVSNLGLTDATNLYAKISSSSNWVTIARDSAQIGTLAAGSEIVLPDNLAIKISGSIPDMQIVTVRLMLKDLRVEKHYTIDVCVHAPQLQISSCTIDDSELGNANFIADPGETFKLIFKVTNKGSSNTSGQFNIISPKPELTILEPSVKSGLLKFGEVTEIPVTVKLSESVTSGSYFSVMSTLDCTPFIVNKEFTFRAGKIRESFESLSFKIFPWINLSKVPWIITSSGSYDGGVSARSGAITHNGTTSLLIRGTYSSPDSLRFYYKVSSEPEYDFLSFRLNDAEIFRKSGETSWIRKAVAVPAGLNKMEWIYKKDNSVSNGSDCAWIDMIDFAGTASVNYIEKDLKVAKISNPYQTDQYNQETVSVKVLNLGRDTIKGFNLAYSVNGHSPVEQTFSNTLIPFSDSVTVSFKTKADLSKHGIYDIVAFGYDNNDNYLLNDTARLNIKNTEINESLSVYPNPFTDQFTIFINSRVDEKIHISICSVSGAALYNFERNIVTGKNELVISDLRLLPSLCILNIRGSSMNKSVTLVKVKR